MRQERIKALEEILRENNAGNFIEAVLSEGDPKYIFMSLSAFCEEPGLLYTALEYASYRGRTVMVVPLIDEDLVADE